MLIKINMISVLFQYQCVRLKSSSCQLRKDLAYKVSSTSTIIKISGWRLHSPLQLQNGMENIRTRTDIASLAQLVARQSHNQICRSNLEVDSSILSRGICFFLVIHTLLFNFIMKRRQFLLNQNGKKILKYKLL